MGAGDLGPWQPLSLEDTVRLFAAFPGRWWISGGRALELHVGRSWRDHEDSDVSVLRQDMAGLKTVLIGWDLQVAAAGALSSWTGYALRAGRSQNNVWCRPGKNAPWSLDVTIGDGDATSWVYRRDPNLQVEWDEAVLRTASGIPYLAPELQLLFKGKDIRPKDDVDAREVIPELDGERTARLRKALPADHPWHALLA
ncbi:MAG TPA: hypothetical protein VNG12_02475 [Acidimicrobiales bacterium]|nr:hypothetical protein [Acidimicrobiales bacterium]